MKTIARNKKIVALFLSGITGTEIGTRFGISRERVRQILNRKGISRIHGGAKVAYEKRQAKRHHEYMNKWMPLPKCTKEFWINSKLIYKRKYTAHRMNARKRGVPFIITFPEWIKIWEDSGKFEYRGKGIGKYVMARYGDTGPYSYENVRIISGVENILEARKYKHWSPIQKSIYKKSLAQKQ